MALSNSVLRRYTPPTCTLEIVAKSSPVSRWVGRSVLKDLRFELRFDDPRKPNEQRVTIQGNAGDLEVLHEAVDRYVQDFLDPASMRSHSAQHPPAFDADLTPDKNHDQDLTAHNTSESNHLRPIAAQASEAELEELDASRSVYNFGLDSKVRPTSPHRRTEIYLQPRGLLFHDLFLGQLATAESGPFVDLSILQLFDLATALDEYATELVALPTNPNALGLRKAPPAWTGVAAAVLLAVGVTTVGVKILNQPKRTQQAAVPTTGQSPSSIEQAPLTAQVPPLPTTSPIPTPVLPPPLSTAPTLPPPPTVPVPPSQSPGSFPQRQRPTITVAPTPTAIAVAPKGQVPGLAPGGVGSIPNPSVSSKNSSRSPSGDAPARSAPGNTPAQQTIPSGAATPPPLPNLPALKPNPSSTNLAGQTASLPNTGVTGPSGDSRLSESTSAANTDKNTLFDNIPQVAEARRYFQQRWKPPANLNQTLEYSLLLNTDGTIQRIIPLGNAAGQYIDRTDIPLPGEPFVSAVEGGRNPSIRLVLSPDGKVKTFLEQTK